MNNFFSGSLIRMLFLFFPLYSLGQKDSVLSTSDRDLNGLKKDTTYPEVIKIAANPQLKGNGFKNFLVGKNYRREWIEPVSAPVINLNTIYGGLVPKKMGGGKQTKSLRVEDSAGKQWSLRSVEKFPENAIPPPIRNTVAGSLVSDGVSGSYPYGTLSMSVFSKAAGVPFLKDTLVYLPDDPALGEFRSQVKKTLVLMEEKEPDGIIQDNGSSSSGADAKQEKTISTNELIYELAKDNNNKVDQSAVLRARLLDNFVMDFDRHEGQWDWLGVKSSAGKTYYPIPVDRDQVFYSGKGLLSKLVAGKNVVPETQGLKIKTKNIQGFNRPEQNFDRFFLSGLSEDEWSRQIDELLNSMTDAVIESALHRQPPEIQKYSAEKIIAILKKKRKYFKEDMMKYYRFLSKTVSIAGTNEREQFSISNKEDSKVSVVVNKIDSSGNISSKLYEREFDPAITDELRIYGLEGDDKFVVQGGESGIKIRLIGGPGNDEFINNSKDRDVLVYDVKFEPTVFSGDQGFRKRISGDLQNNNYTRLGYRYNKSSTGISFEYSADGGLFLGLKWKIVKQGFRKDPYSSSNLIAVNHAINSSSWHIKYDADFLKAWGKTDLLIRSDALLPTSRTLFFGIGNNTVFDKTKPGGHKYYFVRYDMVNVSVMARDNINSWFQIKYGPVYQYFRLRKKDNENKYVSTLYPEDGNTEMQYAAKSFAGGELGFRINTKNDQLIPTRGIDLNVYGRSLAGLNKFSNPVTQTGGDLSLYTDFISKKHVVLATSFGASHITGKYELEQAQYLGFKQNLRGFRIDRFGGRSRVYNNSEIRFISNNANLGLFRGAVGLLLFNDAGRVWADNETSTQWHDGYGWGILVAPLNRLLVTASMMYSNEEKNLVLLNFGFQF
jgi:hypothetical protein